VTTAELADFGEWVALVELLDEQAPELLRAFGYPASVVGRLESLASRLEQDGQIEDSSAVARALTRLANVCPPLAWRLREAAHGVFARGRRSEPVETYVPRPLSPELIELLEAPPASVEGGSAVVRRVLRDL
jgi:hypothetical protein